MFLTPEEITELTGRKTRPAQVRVIKALGLNHRIRPDGFPVILQEHVKKQFDGMTQDSVNKESEPNWDNM